MLKVDFPEISKDFLITQDTYNEEKILNKIISMDQEVQKLLLKCAIHMAIIGYGNKMYGSIRDDDDEVLLISDIFDKHGIIYNKPSDQKYDDDVITARRLIRLFRYQIQNFIIKEKRPSYLWAKYSPRKINKMNICFPGAEYLIEDEQDADYLMGCYEELDDKLGTQFVSRLTRIFLARGVSLPQKEDNDSEIKN